MRVQVLLKKPQNLLNDWVVTQLNKSCFIDFTLIDITLGKILLNPCLIRVIRVPSTSRSSTPRSSTSHSENPFKSVSHLCNPCSIEIPQIHITQIDITQTNIPQIDITQTNITQKTSPPFFYAATNSTSRHHRAKTCPGDYRTYVGYFTRRPRCGLVHGFGSRT